jgi:hypothetical protein
MQISPIIIAENREKWLSGVRTLPYPPAILALGAESPSDSTSPKSLLEQTFKRFEQIKFHFDMKKRKNQAATRRPNHRRPKI